MKCVRCGTENIEEAKFCKKCGKRLDGKAVCPNCGRMIPDDGEFCIYCGANRNATYEENHPEGSKTLASETNISNSGIYVPTRKPVEKAVSEKPVIADTKRNHFLHLFSSIFASLTILVCFIFAFLLGVTTSVGTASSAGVSDQIYNIYYFFSDAFKAIPDSSPVYSYGLIGPVLGLIAVILGLGGTVIVTIFGVREFVRFLQKKEHNLQKYSVISLFTYLGFVVLYMMNMATSMSSSGVTISIILNGATIAGIVLGSVFMLASIVLNLIVRGSIKQNIKAYLINAISTAVFTILTIVSIPLIGKGIITISSATGSPYTLTTSIGINGYSSSMFNFATSIYYGSDDLWDEFVMNFVSNTIFIVVLFMLVILFVYSLIQCLKNTITNFGFETKKQSIIYGVISGSSITLFSVFDLVFATTISPYFVSGDRNLVIPIVLMFLGLLMDVCMIASYFLQKKHKDYSTVSE